MNQLDQLKQFSTVVADTGDFQAMHLYAPQDATTNPSLILKAVQKPEYQSLFVDVVYAHKYEKYEEIVNQILVAFGKKILAIIPGRVSTEVDARYSYNVEDTLTCARKIIGLYEAAGIARERVLIKIAATWEGVCAAAILEKENIHCNMTLLFSLAQAVACADAKVTLISPFVGRITDWYKKNTGQEYTSQTDPGVQSVKRIYDYYRKFDCKTEIMGASFRNTGQILALAGCDLLTISPDLMSELTISTAAITRQLSVENAKASAHQHIAMDATTFKTMLEQDKMASEKLTEGIATFSADIEKLISLIEAVKQQ